MNRSWIWKSAVAGLCGSAAHFLLMYFKSASGLLPSFQPYHSLQIALSHWTGTQINPLVPWALSFLNGSTLVGFLFGRSYFWLPGRNGASKGLLFGLMMWVVMGSVFFPLIGLGLFATGIGLGGWPALYALTMLLAYSVVMGMVYDALGKSSRSARRRKSV
ncbi:MAG: DUF6789 family protein [Pseudorhodoplanes sp.]|jgi:hypothetical protein